VDTAFWIKLMHKQSIRAKYRLNLNAFCSNTRITAPQMKNAQATHICVACAFIVFYQVEERLKADRKVTARQSFYSTTTAFSVATEVLCIRTYYLSEPVSSPSDTKTTEESSD